MSYTLPEDVNPFRAPVAGIGEPGFEPAPGDEDAEFIRRSHIGHEASVKSLGLLNYLGAFFCGIATIFMFVLASGLVPLNQPNANPNGASPETLRLIFLGVGVLYLIFSVLYGMLGYGLRGLHPWARWTTVVLTGLGLAYTLVVSGVAFLSNPAVGLISLLVGSAIPGYILYLLVAAKAGVIFSPAYKDVIRKTPHVKYRTSLIVKIFLAILLLVIVLGVVGAIMSSMPR